MKTCSIPDCDKRLLARGWCSAHYNLWRKHGKPERVLGRHGRGPKDPTYLSWTAMNARCATGKYKGRFTVCSRWQGPDGFTNFLADMDERLPNTTLDRVNNNEGYFPENCRWASPSEQSINTSVNRIVDYRGVKKPLSVHCKAMNMPYTAVFKRLQRGWEVHRALEQPLKGV